MQIPICDIIVLSWNRPELTRACVKSVLENTDLAAKLIIVDNGSHEETRAFLQSLKGNNLVAIQVLYNETNEGYPKGCNQGMRISTAPYVCLLNNDTVAWPGWLKEMIEVARRAPEIGIVNPASNNFGDPPERTLPQKIVTEMGTCIGFCMLIKREVIEKIGYLDEEFEKAYYEDADYCFRAKRSGFLCVLAHRAYAYHVGEASSPSRTPDYIQRNRRYFLKKWGPAERILYPCLIEDPLANLGQLKKTLEQLVHLTRQAHVFIDILCHNPSGYSKEFLFEQSGLMDHADIHFIPLNGIAGLIPYHTLKRVLLKRKKPYTQLLYSQPRIGSFLKATRWIHRLPVGLVGYRQE